VIRVLFSLQHGSQLRRYFYVSCWLAGLLLSCAGCSGGIFYQTARYIRYTILPGDTLTSVGERFDISVTELMDVNRISNPSRLAAGRELKIPFRGQSLTKNSRDARASLASSKGKLFRRSNRNSSRMVKLGRAKQYVGELIWPVSIKNKRNRISSRFGTRWYNFHEGIDISAPAGSSIKAAHDGLVVYSGSGYRGYGNMIVVRGDQILTVYAHNQKNLVKRGSQVKKGQMIGRVGSTGKATGPHLHFETRINTAQGGHLAVDPLAFFSN
jgi:murein DD-endopeptidase MepM/ murein hydrolase activator NlpD